MTGLQPLHLEFLKIRIPPIGSLHTLLTSLPWLSVGKMFYISILQTVLMTGHPDEISWITSPISPVNIISILANRFGMRVSLTGFSLQVISSHWFNGFLYVFLVLHSVGCILAAAVEWFWSSHLYFALAIALGNVLSYSPYATGCSADFARWCILSAVW